MFYVTLKMSNEMELSSLAQSHGTFTEGRQYPVLEVTNSNLLGLQFLLADDNGSFRYYKPDLCKFASMDGGSATNLGEPATDAGKSAMNGEPATNLEEPIGEPAITKKPKMGRPAKEI